MKVNSICMHLTISVFYFLWKPSFHHFFQSAELPLTFMQCDLLVMDSVSVYLEVFLYNFYF